MESQPQNPEFRNNPENFHPCTCQYTILNCYRHPDVYLNHYHSQKGCVCVFLEAERFSVLFSNPKKIFREQ